MLSLRQGGDCGTVPSAHDGNPHLDEREKAYRQGNWIFSEILILLEAKLKEHLMHCGDSKRSFVSADEKWKRIAEYCLSKGVQRTKDQCRIKWDNMMPDFRKIREYEDQKEPGAQSYFDMPTWERRSKLLPSNMDLEVYQRIANIFSIKPFKGSLKREAREKRASEATATTPPLFIAFSEEGSNGADLDKDGLCVSNFLNKQSDSPTPRKRMRRNAVEIALPVMNIPPDVKVDIQKPEDDSSTEDDTTVSSHSLQQASVLPSLFAERSNILNQYVNRNGILQPQNGRFESQSTLPPSFLSLQNRHPQTTPSQERANNARPVNLLDAKGLSALQYANRTSSHDVLSTIEDRKDSRHKELMALEREKLAAFREASITISNALTSVVSMFSRIAEELFLSPR
ncbi:hypothetical protein KP509_22G077600 [Ceratopteris richardii]|nr:hypothetical protein KP509_22G077600 [Ceratopteris richardii]